MSDHRPICIIPARGGSKGVVDKNLREVGGESLIGRTIRTMLEVAGPGRVWVSTDSPRIAAAAEAAGASVVERPADLASDEASSESALAHALEVIGADGATPVVFSQCTSPFIDPDDVARAVAMVASGAVDGAFSAVRTHRFLWRATGSGDREVVVPVNHRQESRERRQDRPTEYVETGAFYVFTVEGFARSGSRFPGTTGAVEVDERFAIEIDSEADLARARELAAAHSVAAAPLRVGVETLVLDFDGVMTDNRAMLSSDGVESVYVSRSDGWAISRACRAGLRVLVLSSERNDVVRLRAEKLGIEVISGLGVDKRTALEAWIAEEKIDPTSLAYVGNDTNDIAAMKLAALRIAVADADPSVKALAHVVLAAPGGAHAVREAIDLICPDTEDENV